MNEFAEGPTGMHAAQDMHELLPGEMIYLPPAPVLEGVRWTKGTAPGALATVEYKSGQLEVRGPGIPSQRAAEAGELSRLAWPAGVMYLVGTLDLPWAGKIYKVKV